MKFIKEHPEAVVLFLIGFILRLFYAHLDPYLHEWDERFHALVARNLMDHPLTPMLRNHPIVPYDVNSWCCNTIWLHKQPLFMWQMAASMKIFGVNEFAMRYPSVLLGSIMILLIYRITFLFTQNKWTSLFAGVLLCFSQYQLEQISGQIGMDHNDVAFGFYILASFWALSEYWNHNKLKYAILCGVFAGAAILNKWLVGALVFVPYGCLTVYSFIQRRDKKGLMHLVWSVLSCLVICLPWQLYILSHYHDLAIYEYEYNSKHIWEAIEGHTGDALFYYNLFDDYFGRYLGFLILPGIAFAWWTHRKMKGNLQVALLLGFLVPMLFFSFIAKTKMPSYAFIAAPFGMIYIAVCVGALITWTQQKIFPMVLMLGLAIISLNPQKSIARRANNPMRETLIHNTNIYKKLPSLLPDSIHTIINVNSFEDVDIMFYNNQLTAYHWWIDITTLDSLRQHKVWLAAFAPHGSYAFPPEYWNYPYLYKIDTLLK